MDKVIRLEKFDVPSTDHSASKQWKLWFRNFEYFLTTIAGYTPDKLEVLYLYIGTSVADIIDGCQDSEEAINLLKSVYEKKLNEVNARHLLSTRIQRPDELIWSFSTSFEYFGSWLQFQEREC